MPEPAHTPESIGPSEDSSRLRIEWGDGVVAEYVPRYLRQFCPCAGCVDEMTGVRTLRPEDVSTDVYPLEIHYVGRYALQPVWSDGHRTGLYTFEYLRELWDAADEPS